MSGKVMLWNCLKIYCPHLATLTFCDYWLCKIYWHCQAEKVQKLLPGNNRPLIFRVLNTNRSFLLHIFNTHKKKGKTSCKAKLKKERRKIPLIKRKSEQGFAPSWLKSMLKSIITSKQGRPCPRMLRDQFLCQLGLAAGGKYLGEGQLAAEQPHVSSRLMRVLQASSPRP